MKFKFTTDFQFDLLRYTVLDKNGYKAIELYDDSYFTLTEHSVIAYALKGYYKRKKVIPGRTILIEELLKTFDHREFVNNLTDEDRKEILSITDAIFKGSVKDGDDILENTERFAQYVDVKHEVENVDLLDYEQYEVFSRKIQKAISPRIQSIEEKGSFLVQDVRIRQIRRKERTSIIPLPWPQLNRLTNAGGYARGSILVVLDRAKKFKTGALVNIAVKYIKRKKTVLVIDLDNGEDEFMTRVEQCLMGVTKLEILEDPKDILNKKVRGLMRRYKTLGAELIVKRMPSLVTTAADIGNYIDYLYRDFGIQVEILMVDYISKMGAISGKDSLHERVSEAYIDIGNLALTKSLDLVWTAQHVTREAAKLREKSKYDSTDVAGSIDITRHVQAIYGLNRDAREEEHGFQRLEIIDQRDGPPHGNVVFKIDIEQQRMVALTKEEHADYKKNIRPDQAPEETGYKSAKKKQDLDA